MYVSGHWSKIRTFGLPTWRSRSDCNSCAPRCVFYIDLARQFPGNHLSARHLLCPWLFRTISTPRSSSLVTTRQKLKYRSDVNLESRVVILGMALVSLLRIINDRQLSGKVRYTGIVMMVADRRTVSCHQSLWFSASWVRHQHCGVTAIYLQLLSTGTCRLCGWWSAVVCIHRQLIGRGLICAYLWVVDFDLSGSDSAETMCDEEGLKLAATISYNNVIDNRRRQPVFHGRSRHGQGGTPPLEML